ncbi:hypothetical protein [Flavobacterium sp.]|uniref:hypothetical protein n=1 Tax=Flavobacterium sp. TaxID=239 RepID=UPI00286C0F76|nr:hypothetical protein [Flavobacterium sp.]
MKNNKLLLIFPDGVGIRNYLYSRVFKNTKFDLILFHNFDSQSITEIKKNTTILNEITIPEYKESIKEKFLRELICLARLKYNSEITKNKSLLTNWNWNQKTFSKKIFYKTIEAISIFYKKYSNILKLEIRYQKAIRKNIFYKEIKSILEKENPLGIFCSHQRGLKMATIFAAAADLAIPTSTVIYSWDNLPKARLALRADQYLVWSDFMKKEMKLYYPEISQDKVIVTGTPQFEFYENKDNIIDKEIFYKNYNLDFNKKVICFSGNDEKSSPDDPKYLEDVAKEIANSGFENKYQILFRRCPVDLSGRFDKVIHKYAGLIKEATPLWYFNDAKNWTTIYPTFEDVKLLASTAFYSDVVINVGSTMAFDFAMYDKPCIFIHYDQEEKLDVRWSTETIYQFQHFRSMPNKKAVIWLDNKREIIDKIEKALSLNHNEHMDSWKKIVLGDYQNASSSILKNI